MELTEDELIKFISENRDVIVDEPFNGFTRNKMIFHAVRHKDSKKIFALVYVKDDKLFVDLKADPSVASDLIEAVPYILQGQHFDKIHWLTVDIQEIESKTELANLIEKSYQLTKKL
ncbi:MmcQ/YjbR family DNA-binding protein [Companilactobacillus mishanensis]|uniref:MmcQ/YjbR family DNA-binding protein n=1 Tax=Companilactobacillus mishanensis TaxID=2486008 RepID=UPI001294FAFB|nr:MmcQ/YjbR family DNA-binding protein [Companilactobacillus mishanensis]MQS88900.1 hypothetical protein [Companilactobacillus mishanensis]